MTDGDRLPEDYGHILPPEKPRRFPGGAVIGIIIVIAFAGGLWYGYHRGVDEGKTSGTPPLIKATPGPTKVTPANPGGVNIPNQKASVYDRMSGNGNPSTVEHLAPPPQQPMAGALPQTQGANSGATGTPTAGAGQVSAGQGGSTTSGPTSAPTSAPAGQPAVSEAPAGAPAAAGQTAPPPAAASEPAKQTPAPQAASSPAKPMTSAAKPRTARTVPMARGVRVQVGAYRTVAEANADWRRLGKRNAALMHGLHPSILRVDLGSRGVFQRLQAGPFRDLAAARHFCARLKAEGHGCFVVAH